MHKKSFLVYLTLLLALGSCISKAQEPLIIPLGRDCGPAGYLRTCNLRKVAYPLDWLVTEDFMQVCRLIEEKFAYFLEGSALRLNENGRAIINTRYDIHFIHDFPTSERNEVSQDDGQTGNIPHNFLDHLPNVKKKYQPRIDRFFNALNGSTPVVFIRTHITPDEAQAFINLINIYYPKLKYTLAVIHKHSDLKYEWNIPNVLNFYVNPPSGQYTAADDWYNVFKELGLTRYTTRKPLDIENSEYTIDHSHCCK